jgi:hypothetical protein
MQQLWAPELRKKHGPLELLTIPVHEACNSAYEFDEDYFVKTILPFVPASYAGDALFRRAVGRYHKGKKRPLMTKVLQEFDHAPSGLRLPQGMVVKRFDGKRISRVAWKIVRGLHFHHNGQVLREDWTMGVKLHLCDVDPPDHFKLFMSLPDNPAYGRYPGVFSYRFRKFSEASGLHYWALLLLDRVLMIVTFHDAECECARCKSHLVAD